ncbi:MAG: hypothetical protein VX044_10465 [Planctomycetota bacterium]|nr:hypothetical protein [Planctomycetota bacterium]
MLVAAFAVWATSCSNGGSSFVPAPDPGPGPSGSAVIVEGDIGPSGGSLFVATGADAGVAVSVPAGAVTVPTRFRVFREDSAADFPGAFPVYRFEPAALDLNGAEVTVSVRASEAFFPGTGPVLAIFSRGDEGQKWRALTSTVVDEASRLATATTQSLGEMVVWNGNLHRLFTQPHGFLDPAVGTAVESVGGVDVIVEEGSQQLQIGRGSLAAFWNAPETDNVIILHGALGSPLDFLGQEDLIENLALNYANVVLYSYPSARGVAYAANELYDQILANRKPGFGCRIVGHSLGALIGRYLLERSQTDTSRSGYDPSDPSLIPIIDKLVMMAPPNGGAASAVVPFAMLEAVVTPEERYLIQTADDLDESPTSLPVLMNASYLNNGTRYHTVYGDIGTGPDGVVSVASALALPLGVGETATLFVAQHDDLHRFATSLGVAVWIGSLLQAQ